MSYLSFLLNLRDPIQYSVACYAVHLSSNHILLCYHVQAGQLVHTNDYKVLLTLLCSSVPLCSNRLSVDNVQTNHKHKSIVQQQECTGQNTRYPLKASLHYMVVQQSCRAEFPKSIENAW